MYKQSLNLLSRQTTTTINCLCKQRPFTNARTFLTSTTNKPTLSPSRFNKALTFPYRSFQTSAKFLNDHQNRNQQQEEQQQQLKVEAQLQITFTCTAPNVPVGTLKADEPMPPACEHRSTHQFTRHSYENGIVLIQCPSCQNRHLIADHLGWFNSPDLTDGGKMRTIEDILRHKGQSVQKASAEGLLHLENIDK